LEEDEVVVEEGMSEFKLEEDVDKLPFKPVDVEDAKLEFISPTLSRLYADNELTNAAN